jgi:hypothetical protein
MSLSWGRLRVLGFLWFVVLLFCENISFHLALTRCSYPSPTRTDETIVRNILLISDPQLVDRYSYDYTTRYPFLLPIVQFFSDIYMRKSYQLIQYYHPPNAAFFLGDLFDGAKILTAEEYERELKRFHWVFHRDVGFPMYNTSGNHDIGFRIGSERQERLAERYEE